MSRPIEYSIWKKLCTVKFMNETTIQNNYFLPPGNIRNKILKMKKMIFGTLLLVALSIASFAGGSKADKKLLSDLTMTLKNSSQVVHSITANYTKATFSFNGKTTSVFYDQVDGELIGFSTRITESELPQAALETMKKKYSDWTLVDAIMFIDKDANVNFFTEVKKDKTNLALRLSLNGHVSIYNRMPAE
jgi:hypothetical protein